MLLIRTAFFLALLFVIPESLSASRRRDERIRSQAEAAARTADDASRPGSSLVTQVAAICVRQVTQIFAPLVVLIPKKKEVEEDEDHRPMLPRQGLALGRRDWNLTLVAAAFMILISVPGIVSSPLFTLDCLFPIYCASTDARQDPIRAAAIRLGDRRSRVLCFGPLVRQASIPARRPSLWSPATPQPNAPPVSTAPDVDARLQRQSPRGSLRRAAGLGPRRRSSQSRLRLL